MNRSSPSGCWAWQSSTALSGAPSRLWSVGEWEVAAVEGLLDRAVDGHGAVVGVVGPPGIGKSRLVREIAAMAAARGVEVFTAFCESHASRHPLPCGGAAAACGHRRERSGRAERPRPSARRGFPTPIPRTCCSSMTCWASPIPTLPLPTIDPDARRRRLTALINAASLARKTPAVYVIEDAHWIDEVSESMLAEFLTVIPQTPSLVLITYRPEYRGRLTRVPGAQTIALAPLSDSETAALLDELLGPDPSVGGLASTDRRAGRREPVLRRGDRARTGRARRAGGRPRRLRLAARRGRGHRARHPAGHHRRAHRPARPAAKRTLNAAAVIGSRFGLDLLTALGIDPVVADLLAAPS